jgi:hypothetical protein
MNKKNRTLIFLTSSIIVTFISSSGARASIAVESGGIVEMQPSIQVPSPAPGTPASPVVTSALPDKSSQSVVSAVSEAISVAIANRATGTPGLLDAPREVVANIGGYGQIIPTVVTIIKNNPLTVSSFFIGLFQFGAGS